MMEDGRRRRADFSRNPPEADAKPQREKDGRSFDRIYRITGIEEGSARGETEAFPGKRVRVLSGNASWSHESCLPRATCIGVKLRHRIYPRRRTLSPEFTEPQRTWRRGREQSSRANLPRVARGISKAAKGSRMKRPNTRPDKSRCSPYSA